MATVTPSFVTCGPPNDLLIITLRPFGPNVTFTELARASTPLFNPSLASISNFISYSTFKKILISKIPSGNLGSGEDVSNCVAFLASDMAKYINGETLHVMHLAVGHTDGDSVVWFEQPNVMHTGDLFFNGRFPYIDQGAGGNVEGYMDSVKQLLAKIDDDTVIIPGHGDISNKQEYTAFLSMISETFNYVKALKQDGKTLDEVKTMGLEDKWSDWSWNFINEEKWIATLYKDA